MARGTALGTLVTRLRSEMGLSDSAAHSVNMLATMKYKLQQKQEQLWLEYDWPFLYGDFEKTLAAGSRYYDLPLDPGRVDHAHVKWQGQWLPLEFGIGPEQYNQYNADETTRTDPQLRWDFYETAQFEVWPMPAVNGNIVRFRGMGSLSTLVSETDTADLDDNLIVLFTAAALISDPRKRSEKLQEANDHYERLKKRYRPVIPSFNIGRPAGHGGRMRPGSVRTATRTSS